MKLFFFLIPFALIWNLKGWRKHCLWSDWHVQPQSLTAPRTCSFVCLDFFWWGSAVPTSDVVAGDKHTTNDCHTNQHLSQRAPTTPRGCDSQTGTKIQQLTGKTNLARGHFQLPFLCRLGDLTIPLMSSPPVWTIFHKVTPALLNVRAQLLSLVPGSPQVLSWGPLACLAAPSFTAPRMNLLQASLWWGLASSDASFLVL